MIQFSGKIITIDLKGGQYETVCLDDVIKISYKKMVFSKDKILCSVHLIKNDGFILSEFDCDEEELKSIKYLWESSKIKPACSCSSKNCSCAQEVKYLPWSSDMP